MARYEIHYMYQDEGPRWADHIPSADDENTARGLAFDLASQGSFPPMGWVYDVATQRYIGNYGAGAKDYDKDWTWIPNPQNRVPRQTINKRHPLSPDPDPAHEPDFSKAATLVSCIDITTPTSNGYREYTLTCAIATIHVRVNMDPDQQIRKANEFCRQIHEAFFTALNTIMQNR